LKKNPQYPVNRGFSLLEVLVAVVILSVGLLGIAGLQVAGLRVNHSSYMRTQATLLAYDMADRMRANITKQSDGSYRPVDYNMAAVVPAQHAGCREKATGCTPQQMAENDLFEWNQAIQALLPSGNDCPAGGAVFCGVVCRNTIPVETDSTPAAPNCDGAADDPYAIKIWWDDNKDGAATQRFVVTFQPQL
jgi:type IV pilus assembly protein PilV